ncbi:MAG: hypothetical protein ACE5E9_06750 [Nitrospinaceae bacterium]
MSTYKPVDLLIECPSCGIENSLTGFTPEFPAICNQCRERLLGSGLEETHNQYICEGCGLILLLSRSTPIARGDSACRCGSTHFTSVEPPAIQSLLGKKDDDGPVQDGGTTEGEFDWCRPSQDENISEDYNDIFDNDPSH